MSVAMRGEGDLVVATSDGRHLGVRVWGNPAGAPIFWLHGTPGSRMLRDPTDTYVRYGLAVCGYDRSGYGLSTRRPGRTQAQTVDDVVAIADAIGWDRFAVAGASGGSGPALAVAANSCTSAHAGSWPTSQRPNSCGALADTSTQRTMRRHGCSLGSDTVLSLTRISPCPTLPLQPQPGSTRGIASNMTGGPATRWDRLDSP